MLTMYNNETLYVLYVVYGRKSFIQIAPGSDYTYHMKAKTEFMDIAHLS